MIYILLTWLLVPLWWPVTLVRKHLCPQPKRILIGEIAGIGDVVCSTAVFSAVRARYPEAYIALMLDSIAADLAPALTAIDEVIVFRSADQRGIRGRFALMHQFLGFDTFVCLIPSAAQLTAACWAALPRRYTVLPDVHVSSYAWLKPLMTHSCAHHAGTNFVATQLRLLFPLGVTGHFENRNLHLAGDAHKTAEIIVPDADHKWIGIAVGSGQGIKALEPGMLQRLIALLLMNPRLGVLLIGGPKESALAESLCDSIDDQTRCVSAAGKVGLDQLPGVLSRLAVLVGVDSGVTYMADTLNVPLVYIPGPASPADQGPIRAKRVDLRVPLECVPCSRVFVTPKTCKTGTYLCTRKFSDGDIVAAIYQLLDTTPCIH